MYFLTYDYLLRMWDFDYKKADLHKASVRYINTSLQ